MVIPDFVSFVNLISTGGQIIPTKLAALSPDFQTFQRPCSQKEAAAEVLKKKKKHVRPSDNYRVEATLSLFA